MNRQDIVRAWKDEEYRGSLTDAERAALPENPAGMVELPVAALGQIAGAGPLSAEAVFTPATIDRPKTQVHCPSHRVGGCHPTHRLYCQNTVLTIKMIR